MGREATVTFEMVQAVAEAISAEGGRPTQRAIRERLGNGSMGTIARLLQQWKAGQGQAAAAEVVIPAALQRAILSFMDAELAAARAGLQVELAELQQAVGDLAAENERQAQALEDQAADLAALAGEKAAALGRAEQLAIELGAAKDEIARERLASEAARTELAKAAIRLEVLPKLEADAAAMREDLAKERLARVGAEKEAAVLSAQKADLAGRITDARAEVERLTALLGGRGA